MPLVTFKVDTTSTDVRLNVRKSAQLDPVNLDGNGKGEKTYPSGYVATAVLYFSGAVGTKAKLKITQEHDGVVATLAERNFIEITDAGGAATADVGFAVL